MERVRDCRKVEVVLGMRVVGGGVGGAVKGPEVWAGSGWRLGGVMAQFLRRR